MKRNYNGLLRNIQEVQEEFLDWLYEMKIGLTRFQRAGLRGDKRNIFHLIQNLITETWRAFPRTLSYITDVVLIYLLVDFIYSLL